MVNGVQAGEVGVSGVPQGTSSGSGGTSLVPDWMLELLQELWQAPATASLLRYVCLRGAQVHEGPLLAPWQSMLAAVRSAQAQGVAQEYADLPRLLPGATSPDQVAALCATVRDGMEAGTARAGASALLALQTLRGLVAHPGAGFYAVVAALSLEVLQLGAWQGGAASQGSVLG